MKAKNLGGTMPPHSFAGCALRLANASRLRFQFTVNQDSDDNKMRRKQRKGTRNETSTAPQDSNRCLINDVLVSNVSVSDTKATISVTAKWSAYDYATRVKLAEIVWGEWNRIVVGESWSEMNIVDQDGHSLGSRGKYGSIWVRRD